MAVPRATANFLELPLLFVFPLLVLAGVFWYQKAIRAEGLGAPLLASGLSIVGLFGTLGASLFPYMIPAYPVENSMTIYNSSSSQLTLTVMLIIAGIGVPIVLGYMTYTFRKFVKSGRVEYQIGPDKNIPG
ncbi:cytochrome bd-type quinol oxidase subunit 2 [Desulfitispora alkaliphila]